MDKWKIGVIILLLVGIGFYGFYQNNPPSAASTSEAKENSDGKNPPPAPPDVQNSSLLHKPAIDWDIAPEYWVNTPRPITLKDLKGSVTLLEFWRANCIHCQQAAPFMSQLYTHWHPNGLKMVAFQSPGQPNSDNLENDWQQVQGKIKEWKLPYPVAFDKDRLLFNKYHGNLYPMVIVLDKAGNVVFFQTGHDEAKGRALMRFLSQQLGINNRPEQKK